MSMYKIVGFWCKDENRKSGAFKHLIAALVADIVVIIIALGVSLHIIGPLLLAVTACYYFFASHLYTPRERRTIVPDSLMKVIAESPEISDEVKDEMAKRLKANGCLAFRDLYRIEKDVRADAANKERQNGDGYKALVARLGTDRTV